MGEAEAVVGQDVINAALEMDGTSIGKASIEVKQLTENDNLYDAQIKIRTKDFLQSGTISLDGGVLTWGEITEITTED
ncbi:MAG: hypothetical protein J5881_00455 [Clostridia bacterium]|nr:hypothetical protein [Clostridia bacterium]